MSEPRVLIAGASGYAGALAAHLVQRHPGLELAKVTAHTEVGKEMSELYPEYDVEMTLEGLDVAGLEGIDAAIVGYPHGASAPVVAELRGLGIQTVDLSADFRLKDIPTYERWYGPHGDPDLLAGAVYGLPELYRDQIKDAELVANPGCYPTATILALAPLASAGLIDDVVIDAKSGVSGAGRGKADELGPVVEGDDSMAYATSGHRHQPEIVQELREQLKAAQRGGSPGQLMDVPITFVPHLLPFHQGELVSCYVRPMRSVELEDVVGLYEERYGDERFVELVDSPPGVGDVRGTNLCRIHLALDAEARRVMVFAAIDNLWKGAASQAVQNLNLMLGLPEEEGIS